MFTKATGLLILPLWLAAMSWLVVHDVWPGLTADEPPSLEVTEWLIGEGRRTQLSIEDEHGPLGTIWTDYIIDEDAIRRDDIIWINRLPLEITPLRVIVESIFTADGTLDEFTLRLDNNDTRARLHGERFHADFSFIFESGALYRTFKVPLTDGRIISGAFNPVAAVTGLGDRFIPMLVTVTGEERIDTGVWEGNCLVVESASAKAWVDINGVAQMQEMTLPLAGTIRIIRQPKFDAQGRIRTRAFSFN